MNLNKMQQARWNNAMAIATRIKQLLDDGYLVLDDEGRQVDAASWEITETMVSRRLFENIRTVIFSTEPGWNSVLHSPIEETNAGYRAWKAVHPKDVEKVVK